MQLKLYEVKLEIVMKMHNAIAEAEFLVTDLPARKGIIAVLHLQHHRTEEMQF